MRLRGEVCIDRPADEVWAFFEDVNNLPRWDRGVARVEWKSGDGGVGSTFDTVAHGERGRMSYELTEVEPCHHYAVVTRSSFFRLAEWRFLLDDIDGATKVTCVCEFSLLRRYFAMAVVLRVIGARAIRRDLEQLRLVVEQTDTE
jgi:uncharacterized protein YndB with AHSA1/START domain